MKKTFSLVLALIMMASMLVACSAPAPAPAAPPAAADPGTAAPADPAAADPRAERIKIGFSVSSFENENFVYMDKLFQKYCEENNIEYLTKAHNTDSTALMEIMENFMAAGVDGVIFQQFEPESIQSTLDEMAEKGIKVISYDADVENVAGNWICSNYATGNAIGECAADFINKELGGKCEYIVMDSKVAFMQERVKGIMDKIAELCPESTLAGTQRVTLQEAVDAFENLLVANPNVQVVCTGYSTSATNIVAAWMPELLRQGVDLSKYGAFTCDCTNLDLEYMAITKSGGDNILRSTIDLGLKQYVPMGMITQLEGAIRGIETEYSDGSTQTFPYEKVTLENVEEYAQKYGVAS